MTDAQVHHGTFTVERELSAAPERVWRAFASPEAKARWFGTETHAYEVAERTMDFAVGGRERLVGRWKNGMTSDFRCQYFDILEGRRIVYVYDMFVNDRKLSVSLATIEIAPNGGGTRLTITEQGAFFGPSGAEDATNREHGTRHIVDLLANSLKD